MTGTAFEKPGFIDGDGAVIIESFDDFRKWLDKADADAIGEKLTETGLSEDLIDLIIQTVGW